MILKGLGIVLVTLSMVAIGVLVWRLLERQEARYETHDPDSDEAAGDADQSDR